MTDQTQQAAASDDKPYNPWREFIENCINGDNYFRASEYRDLIAYIDSLLTPAAPAVGAPVAEVGTASFMPGAIGFTMACFKSADVPPGSLLYLAPQPAALSGSLEAVQRDAWRPIESAPKDRKIQGYCPRLGIVSPLEWDTNRFAKKPRPYWTHWGERIWGVSWIRDDQPTHWRELPPAPIAAAPQKGEAA